MTGAVYVNGAWHDRATATISVYDHGLLYGDGVFEGVRAYDGRIFRLAQHVERLYDSAKSIHLVIPHTQEEFAALMVEAVGRSGLRDAYLRPVVTRGVGDLGLDSRKCPAATVIIIVDTIAVWSADRYEQGLDVVTAATPMPHREALSPRVKSLNYLAHVMAKLEGSLAGADEVLMLDPAGYVAEASGQNLFVVRGGKVRTPPVWAGILQGVTRDAVLELARLAGYAVEESPLNRHDVYTADEAFLTGTASELAPIRRYDGRTIGAGRAGPVTRDLHARFHALVRAE